MQTDESEALTFTSEKPDVMALRSAYERTADDLEFYFEKTQEAYDSRRNIWPGKSQDLRKHGSEAFPWDGAADTEAHVIDERINAYVALFISALQRANIRAYPVEIGDMARSRVVSAFLKWMVSSYIPQFKRQMELGANYLLEKGIVVTYVGWQKESRTLKQKLSLEQVAATSPDLARIILERSDDAQVGEMLKATFGVNDKRAKRILADLRKKGEAEFPIVRNTVDCPLVLSPAPDGDVLFPSYTIDPQKAPYCFWRVLMTAQELRNKVATEGWDEEWVEWVIEHCKEEVDTLKIERRNDWTTERYPVYDSSDLYEVVYGYQRLIDREDNSEGIYCTVFHKNIIAREGVPQYAKHELLNGYDNYPFVVTKLNEDTKRLYDVESVAEKLKGIQWQVKVERDSRIDRNSLATLPPIMHPAGNPPSDWGPGRYVPYRRAGEFQFGPTPPYNAGSMEMEQTQLTQADKLIGLSPAEVDPLAPVKQQFLVSKFLTHVQDVIKMAFKCYQRFGPDMVFFRVTGVPDPQRFEKGNPNEDFDIKIMFDVLSNDPESLETQLQQFVSLVQLDRNGRIDMDALLDVMAGAINPMLADAVLRPAEQAQQQVVKNVTDDLSKIYAGIEVGARPNGAQVALQVIQQYLQQPDVMQRAQQDEAFQARLQKYAQQYQMALVQMQNAEVGRLGTAPAQMGTMQTQGMNT